MSILGKFSSSMDKWKKKIAGDYHSVPVQENPENQRNTKERKGKKKKIESDTQHQQPQHDAKMDEKDEQNEIDKEVSKFKMPEHRTFKKWLNNIFFQPNGPCNAIFLNGKRIMQYTASISGSKAAKAVTAAWEEGKKSLSTLKAEPHAPDQHFHMILDHTNYQKYGELQREIAKLKNYKQEQNRPVIKEPSLK